MGLNTNLGPAKPFLVKPDASGTNIEVSDAEIVDDSLYFYHATNFRNLQSIRVSGLDPNYGGKGGAGANVGGKEGAHFNRRSAGQIHGTSSSTTANFYALMKDEPSLFVKVYGNIGDLKDKTDPLSLGDFAIILRFRRTGFTWQKDPDDPRNAYRTKDTIPAYCIEGLTTEGWTKIMKLTELDKALTGT